MRRRLLTGIALACVAGGVYLLWPIALHYTAQLILRSGAIKAPAAEQQSPNEQAIVRLGQAPPDFVLKDAKGASRRLTGFRGKVVVLNFWATWCGPCKQEIPWFIDFENQFAPKGFTVLGVSMDEDGWKAVNPYVADHGINYPILLANEEINKSYGGIEALPTTLVLGRDGKVAFVHSGLVDRSEYEKEIRQLL